MLRSFVLVCWTLLSAAALADVDRSTIRELVTSERWSDVVEVLSTRLDDNPWRGEDWYLLGLAHARVGNCELALPHYMRALEAGTNATWWGMRDARVEAAICAARTGDVDAAIEHLSVAQARYKFDDFARLTNDPQLRTMTERAEYRRLAGDVEHTPAARVAGWRGDLDYFVDLMERRHPNPFHTVDPGDWYAAVEELQSDIPGLTDLEVIGRFMRLAGMIEDGHTSVYPPFDGRFAFHMTPIWPYAFGDEWRIIAAAPEFRELIGARIVAVEGVPMSEAQQRIAAHLPRDNAMTPLWLTSVALQFVEISAAVLDCREANVLTLDLQLDSGERRQVALPGGPIDRNPMAAWVPQGWSGAEREETPLWLSHVDTGLWYRELPEAGAIYAQINQIRDADEFTMAAFGGELRRRLADGGYRHLIIDLRHNNGGNGHLNWPFVRELVRAESIDHPDGLFVIVGRRTFSAAQLLANMLEFHTDAIFVGEATGSGPTFYGEDTLFQLPYSGLSGSISSFWFQNRFISDDERPWIAPDIAAALSFGDLVEGRDPALDAIHDYLSRKDQ